MGVAGAPPFSRPPLPTSIGGQSALSSDGANESLGSPIFVASLLLVLVLLLSALAKPGEAPATTTATTAAAATGQILLITSECAVQMALSLQLAVKIDASGGVHVGCANVLGAKAPPDDDRREVLQRPSTDEARHGDRRQVTVQIPRDRTVLNEDLDRLDDAGG